MWLPDIAKLVKARQPKGKGWTEGTRLQSPSCLYVSPSVHETGSVAARLRWFCGCIPRFLSFQMSEPDILQPDALRFQILSLELNLKAPRDARIA